MQIHKQNSLFIELRSLLLGQILLVAPLDHSNQIPNQSQEYSLSRNCTISQRGITSLAIYLVALSIASSCMESIAKALKTNGNLRVQILQQQHRCSLNQ